MSPHVKGIMYLEQRHDMPGDRLAAIESVRDESDGAVVAQSSRGAVSVSCEGNGLLWHVGEAKGRGFYEVIKVAPGMLLTVYQMLFNAPARVSTRNTPHYMLGARAKGAGEFKNSVVFPEDDSGVAIWGAVSERYKRETVLPANRLIMGANVSLSFETGLGAVGPRYSHLTNALKDSRDELDDLPIFVSHIKSNVETARCLSELGGVAYQGVFRHNYFCAKARELMCHVDYLVSCSERRAKSPVRARFSDGAALEKARNILVAGVSEKLRLEEVARDIGMPAHRLNALFKQRFGATVPEYLVGLRMEKAQNLLKNTDLSVNEVSAMVGYSHASGFRQAFRKHYGVSPKAAR